MTFTGTIKRSSFVCGASWSETKFAKLQTKLLGRLLATLFAWSLLLRNPSARLLKLFCRPSSRPSSCLLLMDRSSYKSMYSDLVLRNSRQAGHVRGKQYTHGRHPLPADGGPLLQWDESTYSGGQNKESNLRSYIVAFFSFIRCLVPFSLLLNDSKLQSSCSP